MNPKLFRVVQIIKILNIMFTMTKAFLLVRQRLRRRWWVRPVNLSRKELGFPNSCFSQLKSSDEEQFFTATRMTVAKFDVLLNLLREKLHRTSKREPINEETRLGITLMYLAQGCSPQMLAWAHKIGVSTVREIIYATCEAIWSELHAVYVSQPNHVEWRSIADKFYLKTGMPHCLGAIDGKHIKTVCPKRSRSLNYNYKNLSIVLMATCDSDYTFKFADVGELGSQSNGGVFARSAFGRMILRNNLQLPPDDNLPGTEKRFQYFFVGDSAFPLKYNLMRPYPGRRLSDEKRHFNSKLSAARVHIENAFGILANRWRVLHAAIHAAPKNVEKIVLATVVLHNYLMLDRSTGYFTEELVDHIENGTLVPGTWRESPRELQSFRLTQCNRSSAEAFAARDKLAQHLFRNEKAHTTKLCGSAGNDGLAIGGGF